MEISIIDLDADPDAWRSAWDEAGVPSGMPEDADLVVTRMRSDSDDTPPDAVCPEIYWLSGGPDEGPWVLWAQACGAGPLFDTGLREIPVAWTHEGSADARSTAIVLLRAFWFECRRATEGTTDADADPDADPLGFPRIGLLTARDAQEIADAVWS